jgi:hypothetical protein
VWSNTTVQAHTAAGVFFGEARTTQWPVPTARRPVDV